MNIRQAKIEDIPVVQLLYRQLDEHHVRLLPEVFHTVNGEARPDSLIAQWIEDRDADYLLAESDDGVVGFVNVRKSSHPQYPMFRPHDFAMIENAVVDEPHRGKGIGRALFDAAMSWAKDRGIRYVQTTVWHDNAGAREFYLSQGFHPMTMRMELDTGADAEQAPCT
jgi:ribosomal protein S18 acetylase RimI-like enzyme